MRRRTLLTGVATLAILAVLGAPPAHATTTITIAVNYAGDFTSPGAAITSLVGSGTTNLTASSTGHSSQATSATTITLASAESADFTWHTIVCDGQTQFIASYNTTTKVATLGANAALGTTGTWATTPPSVSSYTIADCAIVMNWGQSSSTSNAWSLGGSVLSLSGVTTSATDTILIQGTTAYSGALSLNANGLTASPVFITGTSTNATFTSSVNYLTVKNLQFQGASQGGACQNSGNNCTYSGCWFDYPTTVAHNVYAMSSQGTTTLFINCVATGAVGVANNAGIVQISGSGSGYGCITIGFNNVALYGATWFGCAAFSTASLNGTFTDCVTDLVSPPSGCTHVASGISVASQTVGAYDLRPLSSGPLIAACATNANLLTDIYGVTRPTGGGTPITVGAAENGVTLPGTTVIEWDCGYATSSPGTIPNICLAGFVSTFAWTGGTATLTTASPHGIQTGALFQVVVTETEVTNNWTYIGIATATGASTFTYPIASNPGAAPGTTTWTCMVLDTYFGRASGAINTGYLSTGSTCPSTAASSTQMIVAATEAASMLGHVIQWKTGNYCVITAANGNTITVGGGPTIFGSATPPCTLAGNPITLSTNFGGTPQSGDAYTIFPSNHTFNIAGPSFGSHFWTLFGQGMNTSLGANNNGGCIQIGTATVTTPTDLTINGIYAYSKTVPLGSMADNGSAVVFNLAPAAGIDHCAVMQVDCNCTVSNLQLWDSGTSESEGAIQGAGAITLINTLARSDSSTNDQAHGVVNTGEGATSLTMINSGVITTATNNNKLIQNTNTVTSKFSGALSTCTEVTTATTLVSSGTTLYVANTASVVPKPGPSPFGMYVYHPNVSLGANVLSIPNAGTIVLQGGSITGTISVGATVGFVGAAAADYAGPSAVLTAESSTFFGAQVPGGASGTLATQSFTGCLTDTTAPMSSPSGLTQGASFANSVSAAAGLFATGTIDLRLKTGSPLIAAGVYDAAVPTDIYGQTRPNPPSAWLAEPIAASSGNATFFHPAPV